MEDYIVLIDNDDSMRKLLTSSLKQEGWQIFDYAYDQINLATLEQRRPNLIILDFNLRDGGIGWEFLQILKMADATAKIPILITTTAFRLPPEVQDYLLGRYINVVHKPFDLSTFMPLVHKTLTQAKQVGGIFPPDRTLPILLVDDSEDLRDDFATILQLEGYRVVTAYNGQNALDMVSNADYCLILLDLAMPVMNGYEFLSAYQQQLRPHTSVVIVSGEDDIRSHNLPSFVVDVLPKPFTISALLRLVEKYTQPV